MNDLSKWVGGIAKICLGKTERWEECNMQHNPNGLKSIRELYPVGTRICLESMEEPYAPIPLGTEGEINFIDALVSSI